MSVTTDDAVVKYFCRHFVSLAMVDCPLDSRGRMVRQFTQPDGSVWIRRPWCFSGFIMEVAGYWFLVTAGHILRDIEVMLSGGKRTVAQSELIDYLGAGAKHFQPIPFPFVDTPHYYELNESSGADYGVIYLRPLIRDNLVANGVVRVEERNWRNQENVDFEHFFMLGLPTENMVKELSDTSGHVTTSIRIQPSMLPVERLESVPESLANLDGPQFIGKLLVPESSLQSIDGMSGGPIIGLRRNQDGSALYWIVAVQSGWLSQRRIVHACPFPPFACKLEDELRKFVRTDVEAKGEREGTRDITDIDRSGGNDHQG